MEGGTGNEEWEVVSPGCETKSSDTSSPPQPAVLMRLEVDHNTVAQCSEPSSHADRLDCPEASDPEGWSSINPGDAADEPCDTLDMSVYSSSSASDNATNHPEEHDCKHAAQKALANPATSSPPSKGATAPSDSTTPLTKPRGACHDKKQHATAGSMCALLERSIRACIDMVFRFFSGTAQGSKQLLANMHTHFRASKTSSFQRYALPAATIASVTALVFYLLHDNHRLRQELKCSCSNEKINRLIVSGLRMKAALSNASEFNGSMRAATLFV